MKIMISFFKKRPHLLILAMILLLGLFFRIYHVVERFEFAHDADLYSWIVKDIVVNHHIRLIGQLTSAPGIFIGGLFYYLLIPFFLISNMDPIGAIFLAIIIGLVTMLSLYFVLSRLFNPQLGLIATSLYATLLSIINTDRWVVPTITTNLWVIWYFYTVLQLARGNLRVLPLLGILIGLIWHVHIALIPTLIAAPTAIFLAKKLPTKQQLITFVIALIITSIPLFIFEARHNFQQTNSLIYNFIAKSDTQSGFYKLQLVTEMITKNINTLFFMPQSFKLTSNLVFVLFIFLSTLFPVKRKILSTKELFSLYIWIVGVVAFFSISSSPISEYYFANINFVFLIVISLLSYLIYNHSKVGKYLVILILGLIAIKNGYFMINQDYYNKGYLEKKALVEYISKDMKEKDYPCIGISYITSPGENTGFRYLFYIKNIHLIHPSLDVPVYNIFIPEEYSKDAAKQKFGHIAVTKPANNISKEAIQKSCQTPNTNLTDSMFGYVE